MRAFLIAVALAACTHEAAHPISNSPITARPGYSGNDLDLIPIDVDMVVGINWSRLSGSPLYRDIVAPRVGRALDFDKFRTLCGFDPFAQMTAMTVGISRLDDAKPELVAVVHGFDRTQTLGCIQKLRGEIEKDGSKLALDNDGAAVADTNGKNLAALFLDDHTALIVSGPRGTREDVAAMRTGGNGLLRSPTFVEFYKKVHTNEAVWGLINGSSKPMQSMPAKLKAVYGSLDATDALVMDGHLAMNSPAEADQFGALLRNQGAQLKQFVSRFDVIANGPVVDLKITMTHDQVRSIASMVLGAPAPIAPPPPPPAPVSP